MYSIYKITSPSGKSYIGLTKAHVKERWRQHVKKSTTGINHPFYCAIRKYGFDAFTWCVVDTAIDKPEAQRKEVAHIAAAQPSTLYNVSPGGEADGETGSAVFWTRIKADEVALVAYLKKLSDVKKRGDWSDYGAMSASVKNWRKENPKLAYKIALRGVRLAKRADKRVPAPAPVAKSLKDRLMWKHKRSVVAQIAATAQWAERDNEARGAIGVKIAASVKKYWSGVEDSEARSSLTQKARDSIDRPKQAKAASAGLKKYWVDLKADPVRYVQYMSIRNASLKKTLSEKNR